MSNSLLAGRSVLVTGAAGTGIGFATALRCAEEGARVAISARNEDRLAAAADKLEKLVGHRPVSIPCDITVEADVQAMIAAADAQLDGLDILVNNAAVGGMAPVAEMTDEQWDTVLDTTLKGTFRCTRAALRLMLPRKHGVIVNNASVVGWKASPGMAHYAAAKAGVMALTRAAAVEAAAAGVRINAVAPTLVAHEGLAEKMPPGMMEQMGAQQVLGRAGEPAEIANVIVFLASDYASYMTGEIVSVSAQHSVGEPMANPDAVGRSGAPFTLDVERGKIREFARATGSADPAYLDADRPVSPPTFLTTQFFWQDGDANAWQLVELNQQRGLHAEQEYTFHGPPPRAGTRLTAQSTITNLFEKEGRRGGTMTFVEMVTEFRDESGTLVAEAKMTGVETGKAPEGEK